MDIKEIRERLLKNVTGYVDDEWHEEGYPVTAELIVGDFLNTEIVPERECAMCGGTKLWTGFVLIDGNYQKSKDACPKCNGTGLEPPITVEQAIERSEG